MKAVKALQAHLASKKQSSTGKENLLSGDSDDEDAEEFSGAGAADPDMALWLQVTTKKFITDQKRLKPSKMYVTFSYPYFLSQEKNLVSCLNVHVHVSHLAVLDLC